MKKEEMTILIIGSGGREHAISDAYEKSSKVEKIIVAPGNDFISFKRQKDVSCDNDCSLKDPESILKIAKKYKPDLIDVAQDDALAAGTVDLLQKEGFQVFGPTQNSSKIEWDKKWSREFMQKYNIPTPKFKYFNSEERALGYVEGLYQDKDRTTYVKATGLCEGKGALKVTNLTEALKAVKQMKKFGEAGETFLIEEALTGEEFSYYIISDGKDFQVFKSAQDNKTAFNFDLGPQTGGMGVVSPAKITAKITDEIETEQIKKAIDGMKKDNVPYKGILYLGGIVNQDKIMTIEYNARWGDPECQAILPSLKTDYLDIVLAAINGNIKSVEIEQDNKVRICVIGASKGYPTDYSESKGKRIYGLEQAMQKDDIQVFGAGIKIQDNKFYTNGGRLFSIVAEGNNILEAKEKAYAAIAGITIEGNNLHYRTDIGWRDVERELELTQDNKNQETDSKELDELEEGEPEDIEKQEESDEPEESEISEELKILEDLETLDEPEKSKESNSKYQKKYQKDDHDESEDEEDEDDWTTLQRDQIPEDNGEKYWATEDDLESVDPNEVRFQEETAQEEE